MFLPAASMSNGCARFYREWKILRTYCLDRQGSDRKAFLKVISLPATTRRARRPALPQQRGSGDNGAVESRATNGRNANCIGGRTLGPAHLSGETPDPQFGYFFVWGSGILPDSLLGVGHLARQTRRPRFWPPEGIGGPGPRIGTKKTQKTAANRGLATFPIKTDTPCPTSESAPLDGTNRCAYPVGRLFNGA